VGLRPSLALALLLAVALGVLQDSFATTPLGLHLGAALVLVGVARILRPRLLWQRFSSQVVGSLLALALQEVYLQVCTAILGYPGLFSGETLSHHAAEILGTAVLGPLMSLLVQGLEKSLRRFGWRPLGAPAAYRPLP
jgi:rod shape-determining protein MreD